MPLQIYAAFDKLQPGDRIRVRHEVKVGFRTWEAEATGKVVSKDRRRHGLHRRRNFDDKVFSDIVVLQREDGELTTITIDEFSQIEILS